MESGRVGVAHCVSSHLVEHLTVLTASCLPILRVWRATSALLALSSNLLQPCQGRRIAPSPSRYTTPSSAPYRMRQSQESDLKNLIGTSGLQTTLKDVVGEIKTMKAWVEQEIEQRFADADKKIENSMKEVGACFDA